MSIGQKLRHSVGAGVRVDARSRPRRAGRYAGEWIADAKSGCRVCDSMPGFDETVAWSDSALMGRPQNRKP